MLNIAVKAAKEAGKILMGYYGSGIQVKYKTKYFDSSSILTQVDLESEKKITGMLKKNFPDHNIFSEEQIHSDNNSDYTWYVDPLDGTYNFTRNIPIFGISIGLIKNTEPILGVLYFPALNLLVKAEKNKGAFANDRKIRVSNRKLEESLYYAGGYHNGKLQIIKNVGNKVGSVKIFSASSYEFAQIAMGNAELYILHNVLHDVAAGIIIVKEAGGKVTDYDGSRWTSKSKGVVASNRIIHNEVIRLLKKRK